MQYINTEKFNDEAFISSIEERAKQTISEFDLFDRDQKLLIAASGGKDSTVLLYLMKKFGYDVEAITINAHIGCYSDASLENLRKFCSKEGIRLHEVSLQKEFGYKLCEVMAIMEEKGFNKTSCSICGTLRRYLLNKYAKELGAKILLTGHNLDDEADGMTMALFSGNLKQVARVGPVTAVNSKELVKRVKPLYFIFEDEVERYSRAKNFDVHYGWCPCSIKASRRFYSELGINPEKKFNLVVNVVSRSKELKKFFRQKTELKTCSFCEQPSSNDICQTCTILSTIKETSMAKKIEERASQLEAQHNICESSLIKINN
jgi:uncharacterized protein (TIGR00269 family)